MVNSKTVKVFAFHLSSNSNNLKFGLYNGLFLVAFYLPLIFIVSFELSNFWHLVGLIILLISNVFAFILRVGYNTEIVFTTEKFLINTHNELLTFDLNLIKKIQLIEFSGFRGPFDIIFLLEDKELKFHVEKFKFQNPKKIIKSIKTMYKDIIEIN